MINGIISDESMDKVIDEIHVQLKLKNPHYQKQVFNPAYAEVVTLLQTIHHISHEFPDICLGLLGSVKQDISKEAFCAKVIKPIEDLSIEAQSPNLAELAATVATIRKFLGDDPVFLRKTFHREIAMLKAVEQLTTFLNLVREGSVMAIDKVAVEIKKQLNQESDCKHCVKP